MDALATNALLDRLDPLTVLAIGGTVEDLQVGQVLWHSGSLEVDVYFPITAVLSLVSTMASGDSCEVALVGREGMAGLAGVLAAASESPTACIVQIGGSCLRASAKSVRAARTDNPGVRDALDRYTTARLVQVAQVAACNRLHPIGGRLARWLLMLRDRVDGDHLKLSQQHIADALGVHRPTIAVELQKLDATGAVVYRNRILKIVDRARLEALACECHESLHREYVRLFHPLAAGEPAVTAGGSGAAATEALRTIAGRLLISSLLEQAARERAEASDRAKDHFLAMVSHELRAPLHSILGWCGLSKLPSPPLEAMDAIERSARAQLKLIEDLIDSARIGADTLRISPQQVDPAGVIESAIEMVRPVADAKHIELRLTVIDELSAIHADEDRLRQVMVNVLMNSVKFSREGGCVDAEVTEPDGTIQVRVVDHGDGIARDVLPHVFERFWQAEDAGEERRRGQGLGLGLNIARALVELHGGTIVLDSAGEGQGTTCTITLPRSLPISPSTAEATERR